MIKVFSCGDVTVSIGGWLLIMESSSYRRLRNGKVVHNWGQTQLWIHGKRIIG